MNLTDFTANFADCLHRTPATQITPSTEFKKIEEWSSIMALIVIAMIDADYNKVLTADDILAATTIKDLFEILQKK